MPTTDREFDEFFEEAEPRLRRALVAAYGPERGREAASEALAYCWEHWSRVRRMPNPLGYLYRVGQSKTRPRLTRQLASRTETREPLVEPGLAPALALLTERQRVATVLVHGFGWTHAEVAELIGISATTVQNHVERGMAALRQALEVQDV